MKRIRTLVFQGVGGLPGYEAEEDLIRLGHAGQQFIDEPDPVIYCFRPTDEVAQAYGSTLAAHLKAGNPVPGKLYDDHRVFHRAYELSLTRDPARFIEEDADRLVVYEITHEFDDETYQRIRSAVLEWYNEADSTLQYKLPPPTDQADNCATSFRRVGIPCYEHIHKGQLARYIDLLKHDTSLGARPWHPEGRDDHD